MKPPPFLRVLLKAGWPRHSGAVTLRRARMTLLPIVARELRVISRRAATYWTRFTFGVLAIIVGGFVMALTQNAPSRQTGLALFIALSIIIYIYSLVAGAISTADCVSEEKREGTLGLLFLTDLKGYDIVLGKLAASSLTGVYGLIAIFPLLGVPLLLGGVAPAEFGRVVLVCVNNLFLSLALGMFCSAICKDERKSIGLTLLIILLVTAGWPGLIGWIASEIPRGNLLHELFHEHAYVLLSPSPGFACFAAFDLSYKNVLGAHQHWFYISLVFTHLMGWALLVLTMGILPRVWQDKAANSQTLRRREPGYIWSGALAETHTAFRRRLLEINPFYWLASRDRFKVTLVWLWMGAGALVWMFGLAKERKDWLDPFTYMWTALIAHSFFKCWLAMEASRRLGADHRSGALELLLSTPLSVPEILRGQGLALLRQFGAAVALICAVDFVFLALGARRMGADWNEWIMVGLIFIILFVFDLITLGLVAMWRSLRNRKSTLAGLDAIVRVCIVPWVLAALLPATASVLEIAFQIRAFRFVTGEVFFGVFFCLSVAIDVLLCYWSLHNLRVHFRTIATQRLDTRGGFWKKWLGRNPVEAKQ